MGRSSVKPREPRSWHWSGQRVELASLSTWPFPHSPKTKTRRRVALPRKTTKTRRGASPRMTTSTKKTTNDDSASTFWIKTNSHQEAIFPLSCSPFFDSSRTRESRLNPKRFTQKGSESLKNYRILKRF